MRSKCLYFSTVAFLGFFLAGSVEAQVYYNYSPREERYPQSYHSTTTTTTTTKRNHYPKKQKYYSKRSYNHPERITPTGKPTFIYSPAMLSWAAYDREGNLVRTGPGSSGRNYCADVKRGCRTPSGVFSVYNKAGPNYRSSKYPIETNGGAPMPWAMFFHGGYAIHGSNSVPEYNASHGCIRVLPSDARWLNNDFLTYGSTVIVRSY